MLKQIINLFHDLVTDFILAMLYSINFTIAIISSNNSFLYIASIFNFGPHLKHSFWYPFLHSKQYEWPQGIIVTGYLINLLQNVQANPF